LDNACKSLVYFRLICGCKGTPISIKDKHHAHFFTKKIFSYAP